MLIYHVDVFSNVPFSGNGLTVVFLESMLSDEVMQQIACEFKQFETIFLLENQENVYEARIFTVEEELDFAGHPILGAAAVIHKEIFMDDIEKTIIFKLKHREVVTYSKLKNHYYEVVMNQGIPMWGKEITEEWQIKYCRALNLNLEDLCIDYPMEVVSTGLPYLLIPVRRGLEQAKIQCMNLELLLAENGAKFVYVFNIHTMEGRTWDNLGIVEDVATGSAAGPMGAYLYKYSCFEKKQIIEIHQGKYVNRPSVLKVTCDESTEEIFVAGDVIVVTKGELHI